MKINSICRADVKVNNARSIQNNKKQVLPQNNNYYSLTFMATAPQTPIFKNEINKKILERTHKWFANIETGKRMIVPTIIEHKDKKYGLTWDKRNSKLSILTIKDKINTKEDWNTPQAEQTVVTCVFDERGFLDNGSVMQAEKRGYSKYAFFSKEGKGHKRLDIEGLKYRPAQDSDTIWSSIPAYSYNEIVKDIDVLNYFDNNEIAEFFLKFTKSNTTIKPARK